MDVDSARQVRTNCKSRMTKFRTFLEKGLALETRETVEVEEIQVRLKKVEELWHEYDRAQTILELKAPGPTREAERLEFEDIYFKYTTLATKLINERLPRHSVNNDDVSNREIILQRKRIEQLESEIATQRATELTSLRELVASRSGTPVIETTNSRTQFPLPKLELPTFSGGYEEWLGFRDSFVAVIHDDQSIPKIQKLRYLRSYVQGNAARVIENLPTSEANYDIAWKLLDDRYNNKRVIIQSHMQALIDLPLLTYKESSVSLRNLLDTLLRHFRALEVLGEPTGSWDTPLLCLISAKLDKDTRREWERSVKGTDMPKFKQFIEFLRERCQILESMSPVYNDHLKQNVKNVNKPNFNTFEKRPSGKSFVNTQFIGCLNCGGDHYMHNCEEFSRLSVMQRAQLVRKKGLCYNCLSNEHLIVNCKSRNCHVCGRRHHTLLHDENLGNSSSGEIKNTNREQIKNLHVLDSSKVILSTALVDFYDNKGNLHTCRILLDNGSQPNLITKGFADRLNLKKNKLESSVEVINNNETLSSEWLVAEFKSKNSNYIMKLNFLVFPQITGNLPASPINKDILNIPNHLRLSDPDFHKPSRVDALIGGEVFYELLCNGKIPLALPRTYLQNTRLGWIVTGKANCGWSNQRLSCNLLRDPIRDQLERFWEIEETEHKQHLSLEEEKCEGHFRATVQRDTTGRFMVRLPFNEKQKDLGSTFEIARRRFFALEKRLKRDEGLHDQYHQFMRNYEDLGHMEVMTASDKRGYYIPHHSVLKASSLTTKLRVVFDASTRSSTGISLNDTLMVGPVIQDGIFELILRFRQHTYVMSADIEKMFRQFWVHPDDQIYQQILWRYDERAPLRVYRLKTITYGTSSAPFLATRCLQQLAEDERDRYPEAAAAISTDIYVDDLLTGRETLEEARKLRDQIIEITRGAGLRLCKWVSNDNRLVEDISDCSNLVRQQICPDQSSKTLGVCWNSHEDTLFFAVNLRADSDAISKRSMLSQIAQLYDPLGLLAPVIVFAKIRLQDLWKSSLDWDDPVSPELETIWRNYRNQLKLLNTWSISRLIKVRGTRNLQLHGFADASEKAYGACIYLRSEGDEGCGSTLVCAKSRVAPVKSTTLPRLELCAAHLLALLFKVVKRTLNLQFDKLTFWSDSTITLNWINASPHTLKTFVANRVSEIQQITDPKDWRHVPTRDNPADFISRGQLPEEFINNGVWESGPDWLLDAEGNWPNCSFPIVEVPEKKGVNVLMTSITERWSLWSRYSSWLKLIRIVTYCMRFIQRAKRVPCNLDLLHVDELKDAWRRIVTRVQQDEFKEEIKALLSRKQIPSSSRILTLSPFMEDGLLRVGGGSGNPMLNMNKNILSYFLNVIP